MPNISLLPVPTTVGLKQVIHQCFSLVPWWVVKAVQETGYFPLEAHAVIFNLLTNHPDIVSAGLKSVLRVSRQNPDAATATLIGVLDAPKPKPNRRLTT